MCNMCNSTSYITYSYNSKRAPRIVFFVLISHIVQAYVLINQAFQKVEQYTFCIIENKNILNKYDIGLNL